MKEKIREAENLLKDYKGEDYTFGVNCLDVLGYYVSKFGNSTLLIISSSSWAKQLRRKIMGILNKSGIKILAEVDTAAPNTPTEDVVKLANIIKDFKPQSITCVGGGSAIDCSKTANALASLAPENNNMEQFLEHFFGVDKVSKIAREKNKKLYPMIAVQVASGSGSHLTKYANVTDIKTNQKRVIIDNIIVPQRAIFDYSVTLSMPEYLTMDGAMDGLSHCLEVYLGASGENYNKIEKVCLISIYMIVNTLPKLVDDLKNIEYRKIMGLATDLGGYAIMLGGTNGPHLNSFSFVDILSHGRACAILNPYYTVFFSPAIENKLKKLVAIYKDYINEDTSNLESLSPRQLGEAVAVAMADFSRKVGFPTKLEEIKGFSDSHIDRAISAAKNPQLESKLKNMPVPLSSELLDEYMRPILEAAKTGIFSLIKNV